MTMKTNKISLLIAAGLLGISMLACNLAKGSTSSGGVPATVPPAESSISSGACENPYYPVKAGVTWNYKLTGNISDSITRSILTTDAAGFTDQDIFGNGITRQSQWQCDNGNLIALNAGEGVTSSVSSSNVSADFHTTELSGVTLPSTINAGDAWTQSMTIEGTESINGTQIAAKNQTTNSCTAVGIESVTVTAGTFNAMRVDCSTTISITVGASETPTSIVTNNSNWYAENVGLVKTTATGENLNSTTELVSYTIP